ncbi:hypothetical protein APR41_04455 [Salegentibacter salinarum]|uniref:Tetracycline regulation of excision, RteC n=1 Tax=Salegentibacter salinarum TaxID=447422 RepID=A0A2N0TUQ9_9FLAO|nr:RteC domain-containing protein [Salegentibacter salinarum]PKD18408.1 hypothetical protein APR41_04455 [Salegentibacter salinarum]
MFEKAMSIFTDEVERIINSQEDTLKKAELGIRLSNRTLSELQRMVEKEDFEDPAEEINFFRNIKPIPMSYLIYFTEVRTCELSIPKLGTQPKIWFLEKEAKKINKFFSKNKDFANYMEQSRRYMDPEFFTRNKLDNFPFAPTINYYQYPEFSTSHDMLWAMIQAMYKFIHYVREKLHTLQPGNKALFLERKPKLLKWTGSKTALVELLYALHADGALNHGNLEISTIISAFEDFFNTKLDQGYKTYYEIKARKGDKAKYLNQLILSLLNKMRRDDEL